MVRNRVVPASRSGRANRTGGAVVRLGRSDIGARVAVPAATDTGLRPPTSAVLRVHGSGSVKSPFCAFWRNRLGGTLTLPVKWLVNEPTLLYPTANEMSVMLTGVVRSIYLA